MPRLKKKISRCSQEIYSERNGTSKLSHTVPLCSNSKCSTMVQIVPCSVVLERLDPKVICTYNRNLERENNYITKIVPQIDSLFYAKTKNSFVMPSGSKPVEKVLSEKQVRHLRKKTKQGRKCLPSQRHNPLLQKANYARKHSCEKKILPKCDRKRRHVSLQNQTLSNHDRIFSSRLEKLSQSESISRTLFRENELRKKCNTPQKQTSIEQRIDYAGKHTSKRKKCKRGRKCQKEAFSNHDRMASCTLKGLSQRGPIIQTVPCSVILERIDIRDMSKYNEILKNEENCDRKVLHISQFEPYFIRNNAQIPVAEKKFSPTSEKQMPNVQQIKPKRRYSTLEIHNSSGNVLMPFVEKAEPVEKCSATSENICVLHQIRSSRKCSVPEIQNSSNSVQMFVVNESESAESFPVTSEKLLSTSQRTKYKRKCSTPKTQLSCMKKTKCLRKPMHKQQILSNLSSSLEKQTLSVHGEISSSTPESFTPVKHNNYTENIPVDDLSSGSSSSKTYKVPIDSINHSRKKNPRKSPVPAQTKRVSVRQTRKCKMPVSQKQTPKGTRTRKKISSERNKKLPYTSKRSLHAGSKTSDLPVDDLALTVTSSQPHKLKSRLSRLCDKSIKRRRNAIQAWKKDTENGYEDDIYEGMKFDKFKELIVDTSLSPIPSSMPTPELEFQLTPRICQKSPKYVDYFSSEDYAMYRKVAEDCMHSRYPEKIGCNSDISFTL